MRHPHNIMLLFSISILLLLLIEVEGCHPQFERELRYLDLYLGVKPDNQGEPLQKDPIEFTTYITKDEELNCSFEEDCLWKNVPSDILLDNSNWWHFKKTDEKVLPGQLQPGKAEIPKGFIFFKMRKKVKLGKHLLIAGNTTSTPSAAVLTSSPVACQTSFGYFSFSYWLYSAARVEVVILRAFNRRKHLQLMFRPKMSCEFSSKQGEDCRVEIPPIKEPFKIGIRAFGLKDSSVGSLAMITDLKYNASICQTSPFMTVFSSVKIPPYTIDEEITSLDMFDCTHPLRACRWSNRGRKRGSEWRVGRNVNHFQSIFYTNTTEDVPRSSFLFFAADSFSPRPYTVLESDLIPCTQRTTTLTLRYWLKTGTQVEVCATDEDGVSLSCAYLDDTDGGHSMISIDVDPYDKPFRFTLAVIAFDENDMGAVAISDLSISGLLCSETPPPVVTTISPPVISHLFGLQEGDGRRVDYDSTLDCDFSHDYCNQWVNYDGYVKYGVTPNNPDLLPLPRTMKGNVAVFLLPKSETSSLRSRQIPCANNARLEVLYSKSEHAEIRVCVEEQCAYASEEHGNVSLRVTSDSPFFINIDALSSDENALVIIKKITTNGNFCPLLSTEATACSLLNCNFDDTLCNYETRMEKEDDTVVQVTARGAKTTLGEGKIRSILTSPFFDLSEPAILSITVTQSTFGSRLFLCPDITSDPTACHLLSGPRVFSKAKKELKFSLDAGARQFSVMMLHDKWNEFGSAQFEIHSIQLRSQSDQSIC